MNSQTKALKPFQVLLMLTGILFLTVACNKEEDKIVLDFTIEVPGAWEYYLLEEDNFVYWAISPLNSPDDSIREDLVITREAASGTSLQTFYSRILDDLTEDETFQQLSEADTSINGAPCKKLVHLQTLMSVSQSNDTTTLDVKDTKYVFVRNNRGFVVNCAALVTTYDTYRPVYDEIMSSFTFKN